MLVRRLAAAALVLPTLAVGATAAQADTTTPSPSPGASAPGGTAADTSGNATFGLGPATKGKVDQRSNFSLLQPRGGTVDDEIAVVNLGTKPITLNIYAADAVNSADGTLSLQPGSAKPTDSASWVTFRTPTGKGYVVVPARTAKGPSTIIIPFTVRVPKNAAVGDHLMGLVASLVSQGRTPGDRSANVNLEQRIAVRVATRVAGVLNAQLEVADLSARYLGSLSPVGRGTTTVTYTVRNAGNVRLGGKPSINVHGLFGPSFSASEVPDIPLLLPGYSATVTVEVPDVIPLFSMSADVSVVALAAVGDANPASDTATATAHFWALPWTLVALLLALVLAVAWWLRRRRSDPGNQGRRPDESTFAGAAAPVGLVSARSSTTTSELSS
jgi:hypothetical protein